MNLKINLKINFKKRGRERVHALQVHMPAEIVCGHSEKAAILKPTRQTSPERSHDVSLISDFRSPECEEINLLLKLPSLCYFVMAALADWDGCWYHEVGCCCNKSLKVWPSVCCPPPHLCVCALSNK